MTQKESLEKAGWVRICYRKVGMITIAWWNDLKTGENYRQHEAVRIQKERNKAKRQNAKKFDRG